MGLIPYDAGGVFMVKKVALGATTRIWPRLLVE